MIAVGCVLQRLDFTQPAKQRSSSIKLLCHILTPPHPSQFILVVVRFCLTPCHLPLGADDGRSHAEGASDAPGHVRAEQCTAGFEEHDAEPVRSSARLLADASEGPPAKAAAGPANQLARAGSGVVNDGPAMSDNGDAASADGASSFGGDAISEKDQEVTVDFRWASAPAPPGHVQWHVCCGGICMRCYECDILLNIEPCTPMHHQSCAAFERSCVEMQAHHLSH
jgi:hypothetical protein